MPSNQTAPGPADPQWTQNSTQGNPVEYQQDLRREVLLYCKTADRHTLKLIHKFIRSLNI